MNNQLYAFCASEVCLNGNEVIINIDDSFLSMQEIYDHIGKSLYFNHPEDNPIDYGYFFGSNPSGFYDCLKSYCFLGNKPKIIFNIINKSNNIKDKDFFVFLFYFQCYYREDYNLNFLVFVSKDIFCLYLSEIERLMNLDIKPEDMFDYWSLD